MKAAGIAALAFSLKLCTLWSTKKCAYHETCKTSRQLQDDFGVRDVPHTPRNLNLFWLLSLVEPSVGPVVIHPQDIVHGVWKPVSTREPLPPASLVGCRSSPDALLGSTLLTPAGVSTMSHKRSKVFV